MNVAPIYPTEQQPQPPGDWYPLSCGCCMWNSDTAGSVLGFIRCKHGRTIFAPFVQGVQIESPQLKEMRTHLL